MERPEPSSRHPLIVFLLILCVISGLTVAFGAPAPGSIEETLPRWGALAWGAALGLGALSTLIGLALQPFDRHLVSGVLFEQVGVASLGSAAILYSAAVAAVAGWTGAFPAFITFGFGVACLYRYYTLQRGIRRSRKIATEGTATNGVSR